MTDSPELAAIRSRIEGRECAYSDSARLLRMLDEARKEYAEMVAKGAQTILAAGRKVAEALKERDEAREGDEESSKLMAHYRDHCLRLQKERDEARDALRFTGHVPCDIPACNCGSWHHRYGLPERWSEIKEALKTADVLDNSTGNKPLTAMQKLVAQRDEARAENERLREAMERGSDG